MSSVIELTLERQEASPWGLRLQGGVDFEKALTISSVTEGSPSYVSGLRTGDVLVQINGLEAVLMTHKQGQDAIISAGNKVPLVIQRFGAPATPAPGTWKPQVELVGGPATTQANPGQTYTKTSLAANPVPEDTHWDVRHNITAKGFQPGAPAAPQQSSGPPGFKSVAAPITKPSTGPQPTGPPAPQSCWRCSKTISGVFLQVKGRPLCEKCFVCDACSCSLKNVGHFLIAEKLYCQTHAMQAQAQLQGGQAATPGGPKQGAGPAPSMPQGLAANLARLAVRPQGPAQNQSQIQSPGSAAWEDKLNANVAGQAGNAEDFTKEFMKQLAGH